MKNIIGIDNGYGFYKTHTGLIFRSAIQTTETMILNSNYKVNVNDVNYWVGTGNSEYENNKINSDLNRVCTLTCLGLADDNDFYIVVGLPISQYKAHRNSLRETILEYNNSKVIIDDNTYKQIIIKDVFVYSQGLATLYANTISKNTIIIDVGSKTIDIAQIRCGNSLHNYEVIKYNTLYIGMYSLYCKAVEHINNHFNVSLDYTEVEDILFNGLELQGQSADLSFLRDVYRQHFTLLFEELQINYPIDTYQILLTGGGAEFLYKAFTSRYKNVLLQINPQFSNAVGYYNIGKQFF